MNLDISRLLDNWEYKPGQVIVRRFKAKDGREKIQLRVDLGLLQMNAEGRPDGKQPYGHASLLEYYQSRLYQHVADQGDDEQFHLTAEDCSRLQIEALQYHHRYICLLQLGDYPGVIRDAMRNLAVFQFVGKHAESAEHAWSLLQFQPQLTMILTRAEAMQCLDAGDYAGAVEQIERGVDQIRSFYRDHGKPDAADQGGEVQSLEGWKEEIRASRPLSPREKLERVLNEAVRREDYEKAAKVRDALRALDRG
jgi:hypothetical protein